MSSDERQHRKDAKEQTQKRVGDIEKSIGVTFRPLHPNSDDLQLSKYFSVEVPDLEAESIKDLLLKRKEIEAAYIKPEDELP